MQGYFFKYGCRNSCNYISFSRLNSSNSTLLNKHLQIQNPSIAFPDCGGCNLRFSHPLYYRLHCTVFHDPQFSLTIRKYHCKVCGLAVLGKDNIVKHALSEHGGKGAYQCQYCKKVRKEEEEPYKIFVNFRSPKNLGLNKFVFC